VNVCYLLVPNKFAGDVQRDRLSVVQKLIPPLVGDGGLFLSNECERTTITMLSGSSYCWEICFPDSILAVSGRTECDVTAKGMLLRNLSSSLVLSRVTLLGVGLGIPTQIPEAVGSRIRQLLSPQSGLPGDTVLSLPKMLSGANAFEISDIERMNHGGASAGRLGRNNVTCPVVNRWLPEITIRQGQVAETIGSHENILRGGTVPGSSESFAHGNLGF
jgi:hypothetical protein